jgi:hypothetical protein
MNLNNWILMNDFQPMGFNDEINLTNEFITWGPSDEF